MRIRDLRKLFGSRRRKAAQRRPEQVARPTVTDRAAGTQRDPHSVRLFAQFLERHNIANIIDVGANHGQFALYLRTEVKYSGKIISVEPLPDAFARLQELTGSDENWSALNLALGDIETVLPIKIAANSQSSSILPMLKRHIEAAPSSAYRDKIDVRVIRLDSLPELRAAAADRCMLKIDTQGYEHKVLQGGDSVVDGLSLIYLELSLVPLYDGEPLIEEMIAYLRARRFAPIAIFRGFSDRRSGQQLQADVLFSRAS